MANLTIREKAGVAASQASIELAKARKALVTAREALAEAATYYEQVDPAEAREAHEHVALIDTLLVAHF
jgi:hypothetical protein